MQKKTNIHAHYSFNKYTVLIWKRLRSAAPLGSAYLCVICIMWRIWESLEGHLLNMLLLEANSVKSPLNFVLFKKKKKKQPLNYLLDLLQK